MYREFLGVSAEGVDPGKQGSELLRERDPTEQRSAPDMFQLVENYRTHRGVVQLAHSLVQALMRFFPASVDKLKPESSRLQGEGPHTCYT